jgi:NAD(P)-dependent dehydrogenase (short-subunit alcohol dehydrogenase family)
MFQADLLKDRTIVVTGGGTGLGAEMARRFAALGAQVAVLGRRKEKLDEVVASIAAAGGKASAHSCDVRDSGAVQEVAARIGSVDGLVNNAAGNFLAPAEDLSSNGFKTVVDIVLNGTFHCTSAFGKRMIEGGKGGAIVNIVTTYAWMGSAFVLPSACAKAGVLAMTRSLAVEWGHAGIRLNAIAPGPIPTEGAFSRLMAGREAQENALGRIPLGRFGRAEEIANLATFLLSDLCPYQTGDCVTMDGGEWIAGGGEFSDYRKVPRATLKAGFDAMKPKKR